MGATVLWIFDDMNLSDRASGESERRILSSGGMGGV